MVGNSPSLTISGTCQDGLEIGIGGDITADDVTAPGMGSASQICSVSSFTFTITKASSGIYAVSVVARDLGTNRQSTIDSISWNLDLDTPMSPMLTTPAAIPFSSGDGSFAVAGTCEAGATVHLGGDDSQTIACSPSDTFSFSIAESSDGTYSYTVAQSDPSGNTSNTIALSWIRDSSVPAAPTITSPATSMVVNNANAIVVSGGCATSMQVEISGDVLPAQITAPSLGSLLATCMNSSYSFTVAKNTDAVFNLAVAQRNLVNNNLSTTTALTWQRDTTHPSSPTISSPAVDPLVSGGDTISISGSCEVLATVALTGSDNQTMLCNESGGFGFSINENSDASYTYVLAQTDSAGNTSSGVSVRWTRNTAVPSAPTITVPAAPIVYSNASSQVISGACTTGYIVHLAGNLSASDVTSPSNSLTIACANSAYSFTVAKSFDGNYPISVYQENTANGAVSSTAQRTWIRDTIQPFPIELTAPASNPFTSNDTNLHLIGTCQNGANVILSGASTDSALCPSGQTFDFTINQSVDGIYAYSITQADLAGNTSAAVSFSWERDSTVPPTPELAAPTTLDFTSNASDLTITGSCTIGNTVDLSGSIIDADVTTPAGLLSQACSGNSDFTFVIHKASDADYQLYVTQSDDVPNTSAPAAILWTRDTVLPPVPVISAPATSTTITPDEVIISGTCEVNASVSLSGDATDSALCPNGTFSFLVVKSLDGTYNLNISQVDAAGNASSGAASVQWTRDSSAPPQPSISIPAALSSTSKSAPLTIAGGCVAGLTVTLGGDFVAGDVLTPANALSQTCSVAGTYQFVADKGDGTYQASISQTNINGASDPVTRTWTKDTIAPNIAIGSTKPATTNFTKNISVSFSSDDLSATYQCKIDTGSYAPCSSPAKFTNVANGSRTFSIQGTDLAGNASSEVTYTWTQNAFFAVAIYHFENNLTDSSLYSGAQLNSLTNSGTTNTTTKQIGSNARQFASASSQYAYAADNGSQQALNSVMTAEVFYRATTSLANDKPVTLMAKQGNPGNYGWYFGIIKQSSNSKCYMIFQASLNGTTLNQVKSTSSISCPSTSSFRHFAVTWNGGTVKFFRNGSVIGSPLTIGSGVVSIFPTTAELTYGKPATGFASSVYLNGILDASRLSQSIRYTGTYTVPASAYTAD